MPARTDPVGGTRQSGDILIPFWTRPGLSAKPYRYLRAHHAAAGSTGFLKTSLSPKRALCSQSGVFEYQRKRQPRLGADIETLEAWLAAEEKLPSRERRTAQRLYEAPCLEGYAGAVDAERRHEREFGRRRHPVNTVFIPQSFAPGEAYQDVQSLPG